MLWCTAMPSLAITASPPGWSKRAVCLKPWKKT
jgi:hypothetical protein